MTDKLQETAIKTGLRTAWVGWPLHYFETVSSTNTILREMAAADAKAGTLVISDYQTAGKGRLERRWEAPPASSLLFSLLFRPGWPAARAPWLTMIAGLAALEAIAAETGLKARLKWPNDLMLPAREGWAKVGGLLLETKIEGDRLTEAVLGVGLNVNIGRPELPAGATAATSLQLSAGKRVPRLPLLLSLLQRLEFDYEAANRGVSPHVAWNEHLLTRNRPVQVRLGNTTIEGIAEGTDEWGRLLLRDSTGKQHAIPAGDVTLRTRS